MSVIATYSKKAQNTFNSLNHMAGPMSQADVDGDGDLDVFIGGRVIPSQYPKPASSTLYINQDGKLKPDGNNSIVFSRDVGLLITGSGGTYAENDTVSDNVLINSSDAVVLNSSRYLVADMNRIYNTSGYAFFVYNTTFTNVTRLYEFNASYGLISNSSAHNIFTGVLRNNTGIATTRLCYW